MKFVHFTISQLITTFVWLSLQQFTADPVGKTLGAFARLPRLLTDALLVQDPQSTMAPDFHDQLRMSIDESETALNTVSSSQPEDPDFCFVDEKVCNCLKVLVYNLQQRALDRVRLTYIMVLDRV